MGVNIYILDRRRQRLLIGGVPFEVGSVRQFWKITELDAEREAELVAAGRHAYPSPLAVLVVQMLELPVATTGSIIRAFPVIGWDEGRSSVTDAGWDYLPILGYAVKSATEEFTLFEETQKGLVPISEEKAVKLNLISPEGKLVCHGQPKIIACREVKAFISGYAQADCTLADGTEHWILVRVFNDNLPAPSWFLDKKPNAASEYLS